MFLLLTAKNSLRKMFWQTCQKCTYTVNNNILRKSTFFEDLFFSLWDFGRIFYALCQEKLSAVVQTYFRVSARNFFGKKCFPQFLETFHRSCTLSERFLALWWKKPGAVVKTAFCMWTTSFWGKKWKIHKDLVFAYLPRKQMPEILWQTCNIFSHTQKETLWGKLFLWRFIYSFWDFECNFSVFCKFKFSEDAKISFYVSRKELFSLKNN